jgi:MATE family multidrug resistance protein
MFPSKLYQQDLKATIRLSIPIVVAQLGVVLMGMTDNIMVGRMLGAVPLGAAGLANSVTYMIFSIGIGSLSIVSALVAQASGRNDKEEINKIHRAGIRAALLLVLVLGTISLMVAWQFDIFQQTAQVTTLARPFMIILILSNIPLFIFIAQRQLCDGLANPKVAMYITVSALILNFILNYIFINWIGLNGAAIATLLARIFMVIAIWGYIKRSDFFKPYFDFQDLTDQGNERIKKILRMGLPGGFQFFFEIAAFALAVVMIGWLGEAPLAAHQIAINLASTTYMMATGISSAGSIRVGLALGQKNPDAVRRAGSAAFVTTILLMGLSCLLFLSANDWLVGLYIRDNPEVTKIATGLIIIAGFFQFSDGIQVTALGTLRGIADVNVPTIITLFAYWALALPLSYILAFQAGMNVTGVWLGLSAGLTVSALLLTVRFFRKLRKLNMSEDQGNQGVTFQ